MKRNAVSQLHRIGAYAAFALTVQFLATLVWIAASWPAAGLSGLTEAMGATFVAQSQAPMPFALMNLYNASFAASAVVLATVLREHLVETPYLMRLAVIAIIIASALFLASGIIPIVSIPEAVRAHDLSAVRAIVGVVTGIVLAATTGAGIGVVLAASAALRSGRLPRLLCYVFLADGLMQIVEFAVPAFLILDPLAGTFWSLWLGLILWRDGLKVSRPAMAVTA